MADIKELLDGASVAEVDAHPDDYIIHSNAHHELNHFVRRPGLRHNITLTNGGSTTKNHHPDPGFDPCKGHRATEGEAGAKVIGFDTYTQLDATDTKLRLEKLHLIPVVARLLVESEVDIVLGLSQFGGRDSPDHQAAGEIALEGARLAHKITKRPIGVLTIQSNGHGSWISTSAPDSAALAHRAAEANPSQFRYGDVLAHPDWPIVSSGRAMHPDDLGELLQYPVQTDASYQLKYFGKLAVLQDAELTSIANK